MRNWKMPFTIIIKFLKYLCVLYKYMYIKENIILEFIYICFFKFLNKFFLDFFYIHCCKFKTSFY